MLWCWISGRFTFTLPQVCQQPANTSWLLFTFHNTNSQLQTHKCKYQNTNTQIQTHKCKFSSGLPAACKYLLITLQFSHFNENEAWWRWKTYISEETVMQQIFSLRLRYSKNNKHNARHLFRIAKRVEGKFKDNSQLRVESSLECILH